MTSPALKARPTWPDAPAASPDGDAMAALAAELFPIPRSLTGDGVRDTLRVLQRLLPPLRIVEVPTGAPVLDWTVPDEWNVRDAWIRDPSGRKVVDLAESSLHVVGYSTPVHARMSLAELRPHLHTLPDRPDAVPYRTSYFKRDWGFCLSERVLRGLADGEYEVRIDSTLAPGSLTYGELLLPGAEPGEVLISAHVCHPALANDNLSAVAVAARLAQRLAGRPRRYGVRFLFAPGTLGAITWLSRNPEAAAAMRAGLVLNCLGDPGPFTYKRTFGGAAEIDRAAACVLRDAPDAAVEDFIPYGYDERQYNAPGFRLPVGAFSRTTWGRYPEYHTSDDDLDLIRPEALQGSLERLDELLQVLDRNRTLTSLAPYGEPQLGRRGLYDQTGGNRPKAFQTAVLWVLSLADGAHDLLAAAERSGLPFPLLADAADALEAAGLLARGPTPTPTRTRDA